MTDIEPLRRWLRGLKALTRLNRDCRRGDVTTRGVVLLVFTLASARAGMGQSVRAGSPNAAAPDSKLGTVCEPSSLAAAPHNERLCAAIAAARQSEASGTRADAWRAESLLERAVLDQPKNPYAWYTLGRVRLLLAADTAIATGGALMPVGVSYRVGAANALMRALAIDSTFAPAANALALAPEPRIGSTGMKERVALLRRVRRLLAPDALAATASLERDAGSVDSAVALEQRALASGQVDSGVVSLGLARDLYHLGYPEKGREQYGRYPAGLSRGTRMDCIAGRTGGLGLARTGQSPGVARPLLGQAGCRQRSTGRCRAGGALPAA
jgi:hypothetical protein